MAKNGIEVIQDMLPEGVHLLTEDGLLPRDDEDGILRVVLFTGDYEHGPRRKIPVVDGTKVDHLLAEVKAAADELAAGLARER